MHIVSELTTNREYGGGNWVVVGGELAEVPGVEVVKAEMGDESQIAVGEAVGAFESVRREDKGVVVEQ